MTVVGHARLSNTGAKDDDAACVPITGEDALLRVREAYERGRSKGVGALVGELGVVVWDAARQTLVAVRDPLGLAQIYYSVNPEGLYLSDQPDCFPGRTTLDRDFIAAFIASGGYSTHGTIWSGVSPLPPGAVLSWQDGRVQIASYWSPTEFHQSKKADPEEAARQFQALLRASVLESLEPGQKAWADLSGGMDSSAVVSAAAFFGQDAPDRALGGTVTITDSLGGDESRFVEAVLRKYPIRNERLIDPWPWQDDGEPPPVTPQPARDYAFYARDRLISTVLRRAGATVLLSGIGPDCYMPFSAHHAVDLLLRGRFREGGRQLFVWALIQRVSIWRVLASNLLLMPAPVSVQRWAARRRHPVPRWLRQDFVRRPEFREHWRIRDLALGRVGALSQTAVATSISHNAARLHSWRSLGGIELRHPLLSRPLVEFCLQLPHAVRTDAGNSKPLLRAAMGGILPDAILERYCTKGTILDPRICWAFRKERPTLTRLLQSSVLADLGCIEPRIMLEDIDSHAAGQGGFTSCIYTTLSLETWLSVRTSRYTRCPTPQTAEKEMTYATVT